MKTKPEASRVPRQMAQLASEILKFIDIADKDFKERRESYKGLENMYFSNQEKNQGREYQDQSHIENRG